MIMLLSMLENKAAKHQLIVSFQYYFPSSAVYLYLQFKLSVLNL